MEHKNVASFFIENPYTRKRFRIFHLKEDFVIPHTVQGIRSWDFQYLRNLYQHAKEFTGKDLFVDIGANIGTESILASETFSLCACFEAVRTNFELLKTNLYVNQVANISCKKAVDTITGKTLEIEHPPKINSGSGRIRVNEYADNSNVDIVKSIRIDDALKNIPPAFIHIDTEGFDLRCLESCKGIISMNKNHSPELSRPFIRIEFNPTLLTQQGSDIDFLWDFSKDYNYEFKVQTQGGHFAPIPIEALKALSYAWLEFHGDPWIDLLLIPREAEV